MKKLDEMDRSIQLRAEEIGYMVALLTLSIWTLYNVWQTLVNGEKFNIIPVLISCISICAQSFSQAVIKRKMIAGDEEYKEPNKALWMFISIVAIAGMVVALGSYFLINR